MHIVVFKNTGVGAPAYKGVITWTAYHSADEFKKAWDNDLAPKGWYEIVAQGVTQDEAIRLSSTTPLHCHIRAMMSSILGPD